MIITTTDVMSMATSLSWTQSSTSTSQVCTLTFDNIRTEKLKNLYLYKIKRLIEYSIQNTTQHVSIHSQLMKIIIFLLEYNFNL